MRQPNDSPGRSDFDGDTKLPESGGPAIAESDAEAVRRKIGGLAPDQQRVIFLRFYEDLSDDALAAKLARSPTAIRQIQLRALMRLRTLSPGRTPKGLDRPA
jgi:RNA polymerase sigma-70 factor (ECF subfamily)